jgi:hypothetical protein
MPQRGDELVKVRVDSRAAHQLGVRFGLVSVRHALVDLLLRLADEGVEQVVQRILADRLKLVGMLVVTLTRRPPARRPLWLARVAVQRVSARAVGGKGVGYGLLRHDDAIEGGACRGNGLGAQRARGGRVDEAGVARVLDAVHDRRATVGLRSSVPGVRSGLEWLLGITTAGVCERGERVRDDEVRARPRVWPGSVSIWCDAFPVGRAWRSGRGAAAGTAAVSTNTRQHGPRRRHM